MSVKPTPPIERILDRIIVDEINGCWIFQGTIKPNGYGQVGWQRKSLLAHRVSYEHHIGPIPMGLHIDHLCRKRACVNPDHFELVAPRENVLRGVGPSAENARKTECLRGHPFDESNTYISPSGRRRCLICRRTERIRQKAAS